MTLLNKISLRLIVIILIIIAVAWFGYNKFFVPKELPYELVEVARGDVSQEISETGIVKPLEEISLSFKASGVIERIYVKVGDKVAKNQNLVKLDSSQLEIQLSEARALLSLSRAKLDKLLAGASEEEIKLAETAVNNAKIALDNARNTETNAKTALDNAEQNLIDVIGQTEQSLEANYNSALNYINSGYITGSEALTDLNDIQETYFTGSDQTSLRVKEKELAASNAFNEAKTYIDLAKASGDYSDIDTALDGLRSALLNELQDALIYTRNALDEPGITPVPSSTDKTTISTARSSVNTAAGNLTTTKDSVASTRASNQVSITTARTSRDAAKASLETAQNNVLTAEGSLQTAKDQLAIKKAGVRQEDIDLYNAEIQQAQAKANLIQDQINETSLKSPVDGTITEINKKIGETVQLTDHNVISLISSGNFQIEVDIYEEDIPRIKLGDPVGIKLVAFPDERQKGSVLSIDPAEKIVDGVVYYEVTVGFAEEKEGVKSGMTADIIIVTASKENVLVIPEDAIQKKNGEIAVEILRDGMVIKKEIEIGLEGSDGMVEVVSGLQEGEEVVLR